VPAAAASWEADPSATRWRFTLRSGGTFADGTPVVAADFARSWALAVADGAAGHLLADVVGWRLVDRGQARTLAGAVATDPGVVEVRLTRPRADLPEILGHPALAPLHPDDVPTGAEPARQPIGNGPFALSEPWVPGDYIRAARWPGWRNGTAATGSVAEVVFRIGDVDLGFLAFRQGRRDLATVPPDALALAAAEHPGRAGTWDGPGLITGGRPEVYLLGVDPSVPPYDDRAVREAVSLIIDRQRIAASLEGGNLAPATSLLPPAMPGARVGVCDLCTSNPSGAAERLGAAGVGELRWWFNAGAGHERVRDVLRAALSDVGVALVSNGRGPAPDLAAYRARLAAGDVGLMRLPLVAEVPSALSVLDALLHSGRGVAEGGLNGMGYADPQVDSLLEQAARTVDPLVREALLRRVEAIALNRDVVVIPLVSYQHAVVVAEDVRGLRYSPFGRVDLTRVVLDR
jgi:ABC-type transport system substrate-binding protein